MPRSPKRNEILLTRMKSVTTKTKTELSWSLIVSNRQRGYQQTCRDSFKTEHFAKVMESIFESDEPPLDRRCVWKWRCVAKSLPEGEHLPHLVPPACSVTLYPHQRGRPRPTLIKHLAPSSHVNSYDFFFFFLAGGQNTGVKVTHR